jgi:hypothetical protein
MPVFKFFRAVASVFVQKEKKRVSLFQAKPKVATQFQAKPKVVTQSAFHTWVENFKNEIERFFMKNQNQLSGNDVFYPYENENDLMKNGVFDSDIKYKEFESARRIALGFFDNGKDLQEQLQLRLQIAFLEGKYQADKNLNLSEVQLSVAEKLVEKYRALEKATVSSLAAPIKAIKDKFTTYQNFVHQRKANPSVENIKKKNVIKDPRQVYWQASAMCEVFDKLSLSDERDTTRLVSPNKLAYYKELIESYRIYSKTYNTINDGVFFLFLIKLLKLIRKKWIPRTLEVKLFGKVWTKYQKFKKRRMKY